MTKNDEHTFRNAAKYHGLRWVEENWIEFCDMYFPGQDPYEDEFEETTNKLMEQLEEESDYDI